MLVLLLKHFPTSKIQTFILQNALITTILSPIFEFIVDQSTCENHNKIWCFKYFFYFFYKFSMYFIERIYNYLPMELQDLTICLSPSHFDSLLMKKKKLNAIVIKFRYAKLSSIRCLFIHYYTLPITVSIIMFYAKFANFLQHAVTPSLHIYT